MSQKTGFKTVLQNRRDIRHPGEWRNDYLACAVELFEYKHGELVGRRTAGIHKTLCLTPSHFDHFSLKFTYF